MSCQQIKQSLWDYYDEATSPAERLAVEAHLAGCRECRATLDEWVVLSHKAFRQYGCESATFLWTRVLAAIESQESGTDSVVAPVAMDEPAGQRHDSRGFDRRGDRVLSEFAGTLPMESLLNGITNPENSMQVLPEQAPDPEQLTAWLVESPGADKLASAAGADEMTPAGGASWKVN